MQVYIYSMNSNESNMNAYYNPLRVHVIFTSTSAGVSPSALI